MPDLEQKDADRWGTWFEDKPEPAPRPESTEPRQVKDVLGNMTVVPDTFHGKLPPGGVRESDHKRMLQIYNRIANNKSSLKIDTSEWMQDENEKKHPKSYKHWLQQSQNFRNEYLGYIKDLVKTEPGLTLLSELDGSKHKTTIKPGEINEVDALGKDEEKDNAFMRPFDIPNFGTDTRIRVNPGLKTYQLPGQREEPWMKDRPKFGFYHELVHAYHMTRGTVIPGQDKTIDKEELKTVGLGPFSKDPITENAIRKSMGVAPRPSYD